MALEKVEGLVSAGARVTVVATEVDQRIEALASESRISIERRQVTEADLDQAWLVISATEDRQTNRMVSSGAEKRGKLVNVADVPDLCNFILPAVVRDGPLAVGISTAGASPALGQRIKREISAILKRPFGPLATRLRDLRPWAREQLPTYEARRDFFRSVVDASPDPLSLLEQGDAAGLEAVIHGAKTRALALTPSSGPLGDGGPTPDPSGEGPGGARRRSSPGG